MIRKLFPIFVAMVVVLAFGSVHAQTTVKIALPDGITVSEGGMVVVLSASGSISFTSQCMEAAGFTGGHPRVRAIVNNPGNGGAEVISTAVTNVDFTGRLVNLVLLATCLEGGITYKVYSADVSPTPTTIVAIQDTVGVSDAQEIVLTGKPTPSETFTALCIADFGLAGLEPGTHFVAVGNNTTIAMGDLWSPDSILPGTRLVNLTLVATCTQVTTTYKIFIADVLSPIQGGPVLVAAPAGVTLDSNAESVAKSDSDPDGISNFVCLQSGSGAQHTELWCDVPILRGDRIVGFHSPLVDPDTGITYWWAELEY